MRSSSTDRGFLTVERGAVVRLVTAAAFGVAALAAPFVGATEAQYTDAGTVSFEVTTVVAPTPTETPTETPTTDPTVEPTGDPTPTDPPAAAPSRGGAGGGQRPAAGGGTLDDGRHRPDRGAPCAR